MTVEMSKMIKERDPIAEYCQEWVRWSQTRTFYVRPTAGSLLARMQPSKSSGIEPNARNHPDMQYFNMAIHTLADMKKWAVEVKTFKSHYLGDSLPVKTRAANLGIASRTYYDHLKRFSKAAYSMALSIKRVAEDLTPDHVKQLGAPVPDGVGDACLR